MSLEKKISRPFSLAFWLIVVAASNALVMAAISLTLGDWSLSLIGKTYLVAAMITQFVTINFTLALLLYLITMPISRLAWRMRIAMLGFTLAQLTVIVNLKVYALYHFHLNTMVVNLLFGGALLENLSFSGVMWLYLAATIVLASIAEYAIARTARHYVINNKPSTGKYIGCALLAMFSLQMLNGFADAFAWKEISVQNRYIPWMQTTTMRKLLKRLGFELSEQTNSTLNTNLSSLNYPLVPLSCRPQTTPNIIMLVVDSLRADMLTPDIMPNTFAIAQASLAFANHFSTGNSTRYGLFGLMYGLPGSYWNTMLTEERGSIFFDITQKFNYYHAIYGSARLTFPEFDRTIFAQLNSPLHKGAKTSSAENDDDITQRLIADIGNANRKKPFFGFAFYDSPHAYSLPANYPHNFQPMLDQVDYMLLNNDYDGSQFFNRYKTTAHYVDGLIQMVNQALIDNRLLDNTILIITSDHGQEFNETKQNFWGHNSNFSLWQTKVPLVIRWPGVAPGRVEQLSSHEDVVPTLLQNAFGCTTPIEKFSTGINLLGSIRQDRSLLLESWTERAIRYNNKIYLFNHLGKTSTLDDYSYQLQDDSIPAALLQENLKRLSQFTKKDHPNHTQ